METLREIYEDMASYIFAWCTNLVSFDCVPWEYNILFTIFNNWNNQLDSVQELCFFMTKCFVEFVLIVLKECLIIIYVCFFTNTQYILLIHVSLPLLQA